MKPDVALCEHLRDAGPGEGRPTTLPVARDDVLAWLDGPVDAVARCPVCGQGALLEMLDWSASRSVRIYALAGLRPGDLALFLRNTGKGSCDVGRLAREVEALLACAGPAERIVARDVAGGVVLAARERPPDAPLPGGPWAERLPAPDDERWFAWLGLDKQA